jgi:YrbI family 3-deoxy-D-manno-octulosonate 8-phosphate phosphatase
MKEIFEKLSPELKKKFSMIKLLVMDFDGTLTDNKVYTNAKGEESVRCDRGDGLGLEILRKNTEIVCLIISKETDKVTAARAKKLKIECIHGVDDKFSLLMKTAKERDVKMSEICYVGNDLNDLKCIKEAGLGIAVADSYPQVKEAADYVTEKKGGKGAVREICELLMYAKDTHPF